MISFLVRLKFAEEDRAEVAESLRMLAAASRQEPGCVSYIPHHVEDDPDTVRRNRRQQSNFVIYATTSKKQKAATA